MKLNLCLIFQGHVSHTKSLWFFSQSLEGSPLVAVGANLNIHKLIKIPSQGFLLIIKVNSYIRVAELGSLSSGAKMAMEIFVKRVFTISASNASLLRVIANLQN